MENIILKISGMTCEHCVATIKKLLNQTDGVQNAEVDLESGEAKISFDSSKTNVDALINVIVEEGYRAKIN